MKELLTHYIKAKSASYNKVLWDGTKLTIKGEKVIETLAEVGNKRNNEAVITLADGRVFPVTGYSVPAGNVYELLNFSPEVTMTTEGQSAHKWVVQVEEVEVDNSKLVSPTMLNDIIQEWCDADSNLTVTVKPISKERRLLSSFRFLYNNGESFLVVGNPTAGGVNENVVFFKKVHLADKSMANFFTQYQHFMVKEERMSWITKSTNNN